MANRNLRCKDCKECKWVSQNQWNAMKLTNPSLKSIARSFQCSACRSLEKNDIFIYQMKYGKPVKKIATRSRQLYREFLKHGDINKLSNDIGDVLTEYHIPREGMEFVTDPTQTYLLAIKVFNIPFLGVMNIPLWSKRKRSN